MPDFAYQVLIRLAVMLPTILITATLVWVLFREFGAVTPATPLNPLESPLRHACRRRDRLAGGAPRGRIVRLATGGEERWPRTRSPATIVASAR